MSHAKKIQKTYFQKNPAANILSIDTLLKET